MGKRISIIIPIYNREKYLDRCISSALNQKDILSEIILVDDGSTDNSLSICELYAQKYSNIKVIHQENSGISSARNAGLNAVTGDYIFFLDSDDFIVNNSLCIMQKELESNNVDYVIGNFERVNSDETILSSSNMPDDIKNSVINEDKLWKYAENPQSYLLFVALWAKLYKKEVWDSIRFPDVRFAEDEFVLPEILSNAERIYVTDLVVYKQTASNSSLVRSDYNFHKLARPASKLFVADYLCNRGIYSFAMQKLENAVGDAYYASLHLTDEDSKSELRRIHANACALSKKLMPHVSLVKKVKLFFLRKCKKLYDYLSYTLPERKASKNKTHTA
ncbi:MAG: glycosyltransferase family 2 protein [Lachnospiraceae bacterium]|nr:glycosyltransferase family 2 protein [Lachnospiraceae bacterium]